MTNDVIPLNITIIFKFEYCHIFFIWKIDVLDLPLLRKSNFWEKNYEWIIPTIFICSFGISAQHRSGIGRSCPFCNYRCNRWWYPFKVGRTLISLFWALKLSATAVGSLSDDKKLDLLYAVKLGRNSFLDGENLIDNLILRLKSTCTNFIQNP